MSTFIESLKRLYYVEKLTIEKLNELKTNGKITQEKYDYIVAS